MKIIIESGSTKSEGVIINNDEIIKFTSIGFNPFFISNDIVIKEFQKNVLNKINKKEVKEVVFYGAGCFDQKEKNKIKRILLDLFQNAIVEVNSDLLGAARAVFQNQYGLIAIIGTGINAGIYNKKIIIQNYRPLGYVLGDEGSGAWYGKELLASYFRDEMPAKLKSKFESKYQINKENILRSVYSEKLPNRFLASFFSFIPENLNDSYINSLCNDGISKFFKYYINTYNEKNLPFGMVGSVASALKTMIQEYAEKESYKIYKILQSPINGLIEYHKYSQ